MYSNKTTVVIEAFTQPIDSEPRSLVAMMRGKKRLYQAIINTLGIQLPSEYASSTRIAAERDKIASERDELSLRCEELERNRKNLENLLCELFKERELAMSDIG